MNGKTVGADPRNALPEELRMLSTKEVASVFQVSLNTVTRWRKAGRIKGKNVSPPGGQRQRWLYKVSDVTKLARECGYLFDPDQYKVVDLNSRDAKIREELQGFLDYWGQHPGAPDLSGYLPVLERWLWERKSGQ